MLNKEQISSVLSLLSLAGKEIMKIYGGGFLGITIKDDNSPVTMADIAADNLIKEGLQKIAPGINIFSEETKDIDYSERKKWNPLWILDPLDGTKEFIAGNGEFCISLALVLNNAPVAGFIHSPVTGESWYAIKGGGAFLNNAGKTERLPLAEPSGAVTVNISRNHHSRKEAEWIERLAEVYKINVVSQGSAIKFCRIAEGKTDIYPKFGLIHEWDIAAGQLIIEEAGGKIFEKATMKPPVYNKPDYRQMHFIAFGTRITDYARWLQLP